MLFRATVRAITIYIQSSEMLNNDMKSNYMFSDGTEN